MRAWTSLSLIFLGRPLLQWTLSTCERWLLVLSHIRATDDLEISHFHAILRTDSPLFSLVNQTLARCSAEIMPVYTITYCETVCSCNGLTVNLVYSLKYSARNYATKPVLSYDKFTKVVFRLQRKVHYKTPASSKPAPPCMITHLNPPPPKKKRFWVEEQIQTIMDKSVGTVVQFERFLTRAKLYPRALLTLHVPTPSPHPTDSVETVKAQFLWSFNIVLDGEGRGDMELYNDSTAFCVLWNT